MRFKFVQILYKLRSFNRQLLRARNRLMRSKEITVTLMAD